MSVIDNDSERDFIEGVVITFGRLVEQGSVVEARAHVKMRMEGKEHATRDGDVVDFRFNVCG